MLTTHDLRCILRTSLFARVSATELEHAFRGIEVQRIEMQPASVLFAQGCRWDTLWILAEGRVVAELERADGGRVCVDQMRAPATLAAGILFADDNVLPVSMRSESAGYLVGISKRNLLVLSTRVADLTEHLMREAGNRITFLAEKLRLVGLATAKQKLAGYLVELSIRQQSDQVAPGFGKSAMAELFEVSRPTLARLFRDLATEGIAHEQGNHIHIDDPAALRALVAGR